MGPVIHLAPHTPECGAPLDLARDYETWVRLTSRRIAGPASLVTRFQSDSQACKSRLFGTSRIIPERPVGDIQSVPGDRTPDRIDLFKRLDVLQETCRATTMATIPMAHDNNNHVLLIRRGAALNARKIAKMQIMVRKIAAEWAMGSTLFISAA